MKKPRKYFYLLPIIALLLGFSPIFWGLLAVLPAFFGLAVGVFSLCVFVELREKNAIFLSIVAISAPFLSALYLYWYSSQGGKLFL
jgi:hypothetical protein